MKEAQRQVEQVEQQIQQVEQQIQQVEQDTKEAKQHGDKEDVAMLRLERLMRVTLKVDQSW